MSSYSTRLSTWWMALGWVIVILLNARDEGSTPEEAIKTAGLCTEGVR
jgi:hypothetical protein